MITVNGKQLRNLEEQVQANMENIEAIIEGNLVLAELGIRVVGQVDNASLLPDPRDYSGIYGDAILVGTASPYDYYIFTRPFVESGNNQWFNIGKFPVAGPTGPQGPAGPAGSTGKRGATWFSGPVVDPASSTYEEGDLWLITGLNPTNESLGNLYQIRESAWVLITNIRGQRGATGAVGPQGPQGEQGPVGPRGPAGPVSSPVSILGEITSTAQLPDPTSVPRNSAYLVRPDSSTPPDLYIIVGTDTLSWQNSGGFGYGTQITVNGQPVEEWNADTKMDMPPAGYTYRIPSSTANGSISWDLKFGTGAAPAFLAQRDGAATGGQIIAPNQETYPPTDDQYISKRYADKNYMSIEPIPNQDSNIIPIITPQGTRGYKYFSENTYGSALVARTPNGNVRGPNQTTNINQIPADNEFITKEYANTHYCSKLFQHKLHYSAKVGQVDEPNLSFFIYAMTPDLDPYTSIGEIMEAKAVYGQSTHQMVMAYAFTGIDDGYAVAISDFIYTKGEWFIRDFENSTTNSHDLMEVLNGDYNYYQNLPWYFDPEQVEATTTDTVTPI